VRKISRRSVRTTNCLRVDEIAAYREVSKTLRLPVGGIGSFARMGVDEYSQMA
jgi:hypothetical protein